MLECRVTNVHYVKDDKQLSIRTDGLLLTLVNSIS